MNNIKWYAVSLAISIIIVLTLSIFSIKPSRVFFGGGGILITILLIITVLAGLYGLFGLLMQLLLRYGKNE